MFTGVIHRSGEKSFNSFIKPCDKCGKYVFPALVAKKHAEAYPRTFFPNIESQTLSGTVVTFIFILKNHKVLHFSADGVCRLNQNGSLDSNFWSKGFLLLGANYPQKMIQINDDEYIYINGDSNVYYINVYSGSKKIAFTYGATIGDIRKALDGGYIVKGRGGTTLAKYTASFILDSAFNGSGVSQALAATVMTAATPICVLNDGNFLCLISDSSTSGTYRGIAIWDSTGQKIYENLILTGFPLHNDYFLYGDLVVLFGGGSATIYVDFYGGGYFSYINSPNFSSGFPSESNMTTAFLHGGYIYTLRVSGTLPEETLFRRYRNIGVSRWVLDTSFIPFLAIDGLTRMYSTLSVVFSDAYILLAGYIRTGSGSNQIYFIVKVSYDGKVIVF